MLQNKNYMKRKTTGTECIVLKECVDRSEMAGVCRWRKKIPRTSERENFQCTVRRTDGRRTYFKKRGKP